VVNSDGTITYTPSPFFVGVDSLEYRICDTNNPAQCQTATVYFTVEPAGLVVKTGAVDDFAIVRASPDGSVNVTGNVLGNDLNGAGATLTANLVTGPTSAQGTFTLNANGTYSFTPAAGFSGPVDIVYEACGGSLVVCTKATLHILVEPMPTLVNDTNTAFVNVPKAGDLSTNDTKPAGTTYGQPAQQAGATLTVNADGTYSFTATEAGTYTYTIPVCAPGQTGNCPIQTLVITVPVNTLVDDAATAFINIAKPGNVSSNDLVPTGSTYGQPAQITGATITVGANGTYTFTATAAGTYTYTIPVCAPGQTTNCPTETLVITVVSPNSAPVAVADVATTPEDTPITGNVLTNDTDADGNTLSVTKFTIAGVDYAAGTTATIPNVGTVVVNADGTYTFKPFANYNGTVPTITVTITDGTAIATAPLNIIVTAVNDAPVAVADTKTVAVNTPATGNVLTNDTDVDGNTISVTKFTIGGVDYAAGTTATIPNVGTIVINADGSYTFTPVANYGGSLPTITVTITDGTATATAPLNITVLKDSDKDGIPDDIDLDDDNDGILDTVENAACTPASITCDTDGDGIPNSLDLDSDGDGLYDVLESGGLDANGDGKVDGGVDERGIPLAAKGGLMPPDTDGDGKQNPYDLDSDGDGIPDSVEKGPDGTKPLDTDGDGIPDYRDTDSDGDGIPDSVEKGPNGATPIDTDGDGKPDYLDLDSDGDGIPDSIEKGPNGATPLDTDGDGTPDYRDLDSDGDGISDSVEKGPDGTKPLDTDGDGIPDYRDTDSDGDGIPDSVEKGPNGATPLDTDGDGIPDYRDLDSDNDGIPDSVEKGPNGATPLDTDGDGIPDYRDLDSDNDGILDSIEKGPNGNKPVDTDGDGIPDYRDLDSDGDGASDADEVKDQTNPLDACLFKLSSQKLQPSASWNAADCDGDGVSNGTERLDGTNVLDGCDFKVSSRTLQPSAAWKAADCDGDGLTNEKDGIEDCNQDGIPNFKDPKSCQIDILLPKVFTPNGDGINDVLKPVLLGIKQFVCFKVYNRWGNLIFETSDPNAGWDGNYRAEGQATESFQWLSEGYDAKGILIKRLGLVTLLR
jgi:gliding motility-associated-like protein